VRRREFIALVGGAVVAARQRSKAFCNSLDVLKVRIDRTSAFSVRWNRSFLPLVCG
jgi:hypothetical protein